MAIETVTETDNNVDLFAPFERDTILEVRTSRMKTMPGLTIQSGIDKQRKYTWIFIFPVLSPPRVLVQFEVAFSISLLTLKGALFGSAQT